MLCRVAWRSSCETGSNWLGRGLCGVLRLCFVSAWYAEVSNHEIGAVLASFSPSGVRNDLPSQAWSRLAERFFVGEVSAIPASSRAVRKAHGKQAQTHVQIATAHKPCAINALVAKL